MNAKQRTPGPWHVNAIKGNRIVGDETAAAFDKLQINNHNCTVATVYRPQDARFIADAPATIAALVAALDALEYESSCALGIANIADRHGKGVPDSKLGRVILQARAVLAACGVAS